MSRIVPSQVIAYIDRIIPENTWNNFGPGQAGELAGLLSLIDRIPDELLSMDSASYSDFVEASSSIKQQLKLWDKQNNLILNLTSARSGHGTAMSRIRGALAKCPDEPISESTSAMNFITDNDLRQSLHRDLSAIDRALSNGEWKAATVLAGSVIEALLLWSLQLPKLQRADIDAAIEKVTGEGFLTRKPVGPLERWDLHDYIEIATQLGIIKSETTTQTRLAKDFRNLIHPGRAQRLAQKCDRATAFAAISAMDLVVRDIGKELGS
jgi:hypothetical protein